MNKKVLANLEKCYSIAPLHYKNTDHILVAAEKTDRCILFDINGKEEETVWEGPGGGNGTGPGNRRTVSGNP